MKYAKYISSRHLLAASPCATLALSATSVCAMGYSAAGCSCNSGKRCYAKQCSECCYDVAVAVTSALRTNVTAILIVVQIISDCNYLKLPSPSAIDMTLPALARERTL